MRTYLEILKYQSRDVLRSKWMIVYLFFFLAVTVALSTFVESGERVLVSLVNVVLLLTPLVSLMFGALYLYGSREFNELLLSQPVRRSFLYAGHFTGLSLPLCAAFVLGIGVPYLALGGSISATFLVLIGVGILLTLCFTAGALLIAVCFSERVHGMAVAIGAWLFATLIYDGFLLLVLSQYSSYPLERAAIVATLLNPVDLGRLLLLLQLDVSALMGYTGAVFERFFGSLLGSAVSVVALALWTIVPYGIGLRVFVRRDL